MPGGVRADCSAGMHCSDSGAPWLLLCALLFQMCRVGLARTPGASHPPRGRDSDSCGDKQAVATVQDTGWGERFGTYRKFEHFMRSEVSGGSVWGLMLSKEKQKLYLEMFHGLHFPVFLDGIHCSPAALQPDRGVCLGAASLSSASVLALPWALVRCARGACCLCGK